MEGHVRGAAAKRLLHFYVSVDECSFLFPIAALHYRDGFAVKQRSEPLSDEIKKRESKADLFAVEQVEAALGDQKAIDGWLAAMRMELALSDLSWNVAVLRFLDHFGATSLCSRAVFSDAGYTHPKF